MAIRLTESRLRQIIREEVTGLDFSAQIDSSIAAPPRGAVVRAVRGKLGAGTSDQSLARDIAALVFKGALKKKAPVSAELRELIMKAQSGDPTAMTDLFNAARRSTILAPSATPAPRPASPPPAAPPSPTQSSYPNLTVKRVKGYDMVDRPIMMRRAVITGNATPVEQIAVECQGWYDENDLKRAKMQGLEAVTQKMMDLSEFRWQAKKRGMEATPELARQVAQIFIDLDLY